MKKIILMIAMIAITAGASAQIQWGVKAGLNGTTLTESESDMKISFYAGATAEFGLSDKFSIQPELVYSRQGAKDGEIKMRLNYLNLPILAKYYIIDQLSIEAGPQIGYLLNAKAASDDASVKITDNFKKIDFSLAIGASYSITEKIGASVRYNIGLSNILDMNDFDSKHGVLQVGAFYKF